MKLQTSENTGALSLPLLVGILILSEVMDSCISCDNVLSFVFTGGIILGFIL